MTLLIAVLLAQTIRLEAEGGEAAWEVRGPDDEVVCELPCEVEPRPGLHLQQGTASVPLDALPGDIAAATVSSARPAWLWPVAVTSMVAVAVGTALLIAEPSCDFASTPVHTPTVDGNISGCRNRAGFGVFDSPTAGVDASYRSWQQAVSLQRTLARISLILGWFATMSDALVAFGLVQPKLRSAGASIVTGSGAPSPLFFEVGVGTASFAFGGAGGLTNNGIWALHYLPIEFGAGIHLGEHARIAAVARASWPATFAAGLELSGELQHALVRFAVLSGRIGCLHGSEFATCPEANGPIVYLGLGYVWRFRSGTRFTLSAGVEGFNAHVGLASTGFMVGPAGPRIDWVW
jgi:hypothetical protein